MSVCSAATLLCALLALLLFARLPAQSDALDAPVQWIIGRTDESCSVLCNTYTSEQEGEQALCSESVLEGLTEKSS